MRYQTTSAPHGISFVSNTGLQGPPTASTTFCCNMLRNMMQYASICFKRLQTNHFWWATGIMQAAKNTGPLEAHGMVHDQVLPAKAMFKVPRRAFREARCVSSRSYTWHQDVSTNKIDTFILIAPQKTQRMFWIVSTHYNYLFLSNSGQIHKLSSLCFYHSFFTAISLLPAEWQGLPSGKLT